MGMGGAYGAGAAVPVSQSVRSVQGGIVGIGRGQCQRQPLAAQDVPPEPLRLSAEAVARQGVKHPPRPLFDLRLKLAWRPAGVARKDPDLLDRLQGINNGSVPVVKASTNGASAVRAIPIQSDGPDGPKV